MPPVENVLLALINRLLLCLIMRQQQHLQIWEMKTSDELSISLTGSKAVWHYLPSLQSKAAAQSTS